ncbi:MAG: hypothetical protein H6733_16140 [Alphaproteobacteria bacterium]|nr:hypothetical protein [Alphaproteobacteria bacterium]
MADPHHTPELDGFDRTTVRLYRLGMVLAALGLAWAAWTIGRGRPVARASYLTWVGVALCAANLHLYDKRVRWLLAAFAWAGLLVAAFSGVVDDVSTPLVAAVTNGLMLAALSGVILKEWFCFRLPLVRYTPILLVFGVFARFVRADVVAAPCYGLAALGVLALAISKLRMPLGHDVGDRSRYQV